MTKDIMNRYTAYRRPVEDDLEDDFGLLFEWATQLDTEMLGDYTIAQ
jgi:hypothetical protein